MALIADLNKFYTENDQLTDETDCFYFKYHLNNKREQTYSNHILKFLEDGPRGLNINQLSLACNLLSFLLQIQPQYISYFRQKHQAFFDQLLTSTFDSNSQEIYYANLNLLKKIITPQKYNSLISKLLSMQSAAFIQITFLLNLFQRKIDWDLAKDSNFFTNSSEKSYICQSFSHIFGSLQLPNSGSITQCKIRLLTSFLKYFQEKQEINGIEGIIQLKDKINLFKKTVLGEIQKCQKFVPRSFEAYDRLFELISSTIKVYGIYDQSKISLFIHKYLSQNLKKQSFINLLNSILQKSKQQKILQKDTIHNILSRLYDQILSLTKNSRQRYRILRSMCDLITNMLNMYVVDFTKQLLRKLQHSERQSYSTFISSLMLYYHFKMSQDVTSKINPTIYSIFEQHKYYGHYEMLIARYNSLEFNMQEICSNPQNKDQNVCWELLTIRNSIFINFDGLCEEDCIIGIFKNLLKYIFFKIYPEEVTEILLLIIKFSIERTQQNNILKIQLSQIIHSTFFIQNCPMPDLTTINCLIQIVKQFKKDSNNTNLSEIYLFQEISKIITFIIKSQDYHSDQFYIKSVQLMKISISQVQKAPIEQIQQALKNIEQIVSLDLNCRFIQIYFELLYICYKQNKHQRNLIDSKIREDILNHLIIKIDWSQLQRFQILDYIISRGNFNLDIVFNCWRLLKNSIQAHQTDFCLFVIKLFEYFQKELHNEQVTVNFAQNYRNFITTQIQLTIQALFVISKQLINVSVLKLSINMLQVQQIFQNYLIACLTKKKLTEILQYNQIEQLQKLSQQIISYFENSTQKITNLSQSENNKKLITVWILSYLTQLLLATLILQNLTLDTQSRNQAMIQIATKFFKIAHITRNMSEEEKGLVNRLYNVIIMTKRTNQ